MDFAYDARTEELRGQLQAFVDEAIGPAEKVFEEIGRASCRERV